MAGNPRRTFFGINNKLVHVFMPKYPRNDVEEGNDSYFDKPNRLVLYVSDLKTCFEEKMTENRKEASLEVWIGRDVISEAKDWGYWRHPITFKFSNLLFKSYLQEGVNSVKVEYAFDKVLELVLELLPNAEEITLPVPHVPDFTRYPRPILTGDIILAHRATQ